MKKSSSMDYDMDGDDGWTVESEAAVSEDHL